MVLFKRKPVQYVPQPEIEDDEMEVWRIPQTEEIFVDYEEYLKRMDFYKQARFICQITGHSGLTFFDALKSELAGAQEVEEAFPEALKGPILRRVQFQTISRIDTLVDLIYDEFRADYYPGETVTVHVLSGEKLQGMVRDKTRFGAHISKDGVMVPPFSRYFVTLTDRPGEEAVVDDMHIARDRKIFTKQVLRSFIKKTVLREAWTGAPWLVRKEVAEQYHIDQRIPPHLRYESKAAERKAKAQQQRHASQPGPDFDGMVGSFPGAGTASGAAAAAGAKYPELKPAPKSHKSKSHQQNQLSKSKQQPFLNLDPTMHGHTHAPHCFLPYAPTFPPLPLYPSHTFQAYHQGPGPQYATFHNGSFTFAPTQAMPQAPPPPPPIKYPIEDLQVAPRPDGPKRPALKYFSQDIPIADVKNVEGNGILMKSVGLFLETWDTLNVYCDVFKLDSFTFDDFVEAMQFSSEDVDCELFVEIHCATLKMLVDSEADGGAVKVGLLGMSEEEDDEEDDADISAVPTPSPEPEPQPVGRATRSSLAKAEAAALKAEAEREPTPEPKIPHRAAEMQNDIKWVDRLRARNFKNGGWQIIVVGLLHHLSKNPIFSESCEIILKELAPLDMPPTPDTARLQYTKLDVNLRIKALQTLCVLTAQTKAIRRAMDDCSEAMTGYRKEKIEFQRDRKILLEELRLLNEERKIQLPANLPPSPILENKNLDVKMLDLDEEVQESVDDEVDTEDDVHQGRALRRGNDRAADRKRKRDADQEKKEKAEAESKAPKQTKQFIKLMKDIQKKQDKIRDCEDQIAVLDNDLREADCPRTRVLGKDRFWNRYYWFERNGMPYAGLPDSSTAEAGYANGCIWVQGPDELEREGYIDLKPEWQQEYQFKFNMTVPERKKMEEGPTNLFTAHQWGYYDDSASVDALLSWLDVRGTNEKAFIKELTNYRDRIVKHMEKRKEYLNPSEDKSVASSSGPPSKRMSTRRGKEQSVDFAVSGQRCLQWRNGTALDDLGHLHSEQPRLRKQTKKAMAPPPQPVEEEEKIRGKRGKK